MSENRYYVYELIDPRDGVVFYVGKGCGKRDRAHMAEARRAEFKNPAKIAAIRMIEADGKQVQIRRVAEGLSERQAFRLERQQIAKYEMVNLTNVTRGTDTESDRAEAMAMDGLRLMGQHIANIFSGAPYTAEDMKRILQIIGELKEALAMIRQEA